MTRTYDAIVIGSGGGVKIALPAAAMELRVAFVESRQAGGTCLNRGCIPSKMLIYPAEQAAAMRDTARLNIGGAVDPIVDFAALVERTCVTVDGISAQLQSRFENTRNLDYYPARARFVDDKTVEVDGEMLTAERIFIATGSRPAIPDIEGLADTPYMTSEDALRRTELPERLVVIGASYIAVELGGAYGAAGSPVAFIVRSNLLRREDREISEEFRRVFSRHHILHEGVHPRRVEHRDGTFAIYCEARDGSRSTVTGDALLIATGVVPETADLGLENTRIATRDGFICVDEHLETAVGGVYALGDVVGNYLFRHSVNYEGEYLMRAVFGNGPRRPIDYGPVPHAIFAHPEVAGVGLTEEEVRAAGTRYVVGKATYADSTPGLARVSDHGLVKVLFDADSGRLIGAHIVGDEASNMIHLFIAMMKMGGTLDDLLDMIFVHPALPEVARDAVRDARDGLGRISDLKAQRTES